MNDRLHLLQHRLAMPEQGPHCEVCNEIVPADCIDWAVDAPIPQWKPHDGGYHCDYCGLDLHVDCMKEYHPERTAEECKATCEREAAERAVRA